MNNTKVIGIYRFRNIKNEIVYVGKSSNIYNRIKQHFSGGDLPAECYQQTVAVEYCNLNNELSAEIYETYYINKYKCKYNTAKVYDSDVVIELPELNWQSISNLIQDNNTVSYDNSEFLELLNKAIVDYYNKTKELNRTIHKMESYENNLEKHPHTEGVSKLLSIDDIINLYKKYEIDNTYFTSVIKNGITDDIISDFEIYKTNNELWVNDKISNERRYLLNLNSINPVVSTGDFQSYFICNMAGLVPSNKAVYSLI